MYLRGERDVTVVTDDRKSKKSKRGQSVVEYILLLTVIAVTVWLFNDLVSPRLAPILEEQKSRIETRAMRGNPQPVVPNPAIQNYYVNQNKRVVVQ